MKEQTKDKKAMVSFKDMKKECVGSYINLQDHELEIAGTHYTCNVITEDNECIVYKNFGGFDQYKVDSFSL